jgi:hypothetical protein
MVIAQPQPGHLDDLMGFWDGDALTHVTEQRGNRGLRLFQHVASGRLVASSVWEPDSDADAAGLTFLATWRRYRDRWPRRRRPSAWTSPSCPMQF